MKRLTVLIIIAALAASCNSGVKKNQDLADGNSSQALATLYNYYASEYRALAYQAFNIATERLVAIAMNSEKCSDMAVVVDIDETVLDNSPYQAATIVNSYSYPEGWNEWCTLSEANAVPGALGFLMKADSLGFNIFYISNRKKEFVYESTLNNLRAVGFPQVEPSNLLLREAVSEGNPDPSDKENRRGVVTSGGLEIVLLVGDNLGDFFTDSYTGDKRNQIVDDLSDEFGRRFIVLPNAMYGNWPAAIGLDGSEEKILKKLKEMAFSDPNHGAD